MNEGLQRYLDLASSVTRTTLGTTERLLAGFVRQGEVAAEQAEHLLDEIIARSVDGSGALARLVKSEVEQAVERSGCARAEEVDKLRREVDGLRARLSAVDGDPRDAGTPSL